jgi:hypothetical protein
MGIVEDHYRNTPGARLPLSRVAMAAFESALATFVHDAGVVEVGGTIARWQFVNGAYRAEVKNKLCFMAQTGWYQS